MCVYVCGWRWGHAAVGDNEDDDDEDVNDNETVPIYSWRVNLLRCLPLLLLRRHF